MHWFSRFTGQIYQRSRCPPSHQPVLGTGFINVEDPAFELLAVQILNHFLAAFIIHRDEMQSPHVGRWSGVSHAPQGIEQGHGTHHFWHINANLVGIQNNPDGGNPTGLIKAGNDLLSRGGSIIGVAGLTAVFGMETGVTPPLWSPASVSSGCRRWRHEFSGWSDVAGSVSRHATETLRQSSALRSNEPNDPAQAACADRRRIAGRSDEAIDR